MPRRLLVLLLAGLSVLAAPATSSAKVNVLVGIGDQNASMFSNPLYQALALKRTRYFIHWDAINKPTELSKADAFVNAARGSRVKVLMHISTNDLRPRKAALPTPGQYKARVSALVARYRPLGVTEWGVWNEANHNTQPTYRSPTRAAQFYKSFRTISCSGCKIVALDVLDQAGVESYIRRWFRAAGSAGRKARVVGIHNYSEVNRKIRKGTNTYPGTRRIIGAVRRKNTRARFWYTETGAIVKLASFKCNVNRPKDRLKFMFALAKRFDRYVERLYSYNWTGDDCRRRFDAGLVYANGARRPGYSTFKSNLKNFKK